jgi:hypothetical protein
VTALDERIFTQADQLRFAALSGDCNPIHVDPVAARRTPYGQVVHGVHALAWVLERHLAGQPGNPPSSMKVAFLKPIGLGEPVRIEQREEDGLAVYTVLAGARAALSLRLGAGIPREAHACAPVPSPVSREPLAKTFEQVKTESGELLAWGNAAELTADFPHLVRAVGSLRVAALLALSRLVGMVTPGLHSLFSGLELELSDTATPTIGYRVTRHSIDRAPVRMNVGGAGIEGHVDAFFRPQPAAQAGMAVLRSLVDAGEFAGQVALVIGGSRGLGETTAKLIAAGGGLAVITYQLGKPDAERVAAEITDDGGRCVALPMDVRNPQAMQEAVGSLAGLGLTPTHAYYFASPSIHSQKGPAFDAVLFEGFIAYYVDAFERVCRMLTAVAPQIRVFYPSTVFLDEAAPGFLEYVCAKAAGEALCAQLRHRHPGLSIAVERLPRMHTDQTTSILGKKAPQAHCAMLPIARKLNQ